jgi:hypothetical protein
MEVELNSSESVRAVPGVFNEFRSESLSLLAILVDCGLGCVAVPDNFDITSLVGVHLFVMIIFSEHLGPPAALQIDRALVCSSAVVVFN